MRMAQAGDGRLHITSRGNVQIRGVDTAELAEPMWPEAAVIASPHSPVCAQLAREVAKRLPVGAPLVALDDGSGDALGHGAAHAMTVRGECATVHGVSGELNHSSAVESLSRLEGAADSAPTSPVRLGWIEQPDGRVSIAGMPPLGTLSEQIIQMIQALETDVSVTHTRAIVLHDLEEGVAEAVVRVLAPLGISFDQNSTLSLVTACVGSGCRFSVSDVRRDALQLAATGVDERTHFVGCSIGCGRPHGAYVDYEATGEGEYEVSQRGM
ncbi:precorrin-3B synthase [Corynebacterium tapiri]